jgi:hypothetical protein
LADLLKKVVNVDAGDADRFGGDDIDTLADYHANVDVTPKESLVNTRTALRSGKFEIRNPANTFSYTFIASAIAAARDLTLPLLTTGDTIAVLNLAQTLTNKTIAAASNTITGIVDANIDAHTTTKITTLDKALLNTQIVYNDQDNVYGDFTQTFHSGKLRLSNPTDDFFYTFTGGAIAANRTITLPLLAGNDILVTEAFAQPLTNKTIVAGSNTITGIVDANITAHTTSKITTTTKALLNSAIVYTDQINVFGDFNNTFRSSKLRLSNPANDFFYLFTGAAIAADRTVTMPLLAGNDTLVTEAFIQTLTNKTLDSTNTISSATSLPVVTVAKGGTGQATATLGFDALSPMTTLGDIIIGSTAGTRIRLGIGTANQVLKVNAGATAPEYGTLAIAGGGTGQTTATAAFDALAPTTTLGDVSYHNGTDNVRLAGNITTTPKFLGQTGDGANSAAPTWVQPKARIHFSMSFSGTSEATDRIRYHAAVSGSTFASTTEALVQLTYPDAFTVIRMLVKCISNTMDGNTVFSFRDDAADVTGAVLTVPAASTAEVDSGVLSVAVAAGSKINFKWDSNASTAGGFVPSHVFVIAELNI